MAQLQNGEWYQAQDGYWYCWPNPTAYAAPPAPVAPTGSTTTLTAHSASITATSWWKRKRVVIPVAVLGGLVAIGLVAPKEEAKEQIALTTVAVTPAAAPAETSAVTPTTAAESVAAAVEVTSSPAAPTTSAPTTAAPAVTRVAPPARAAAPAPEIDFSMPNLIGENLQDAQNEVQTHGIFFSRSHDLLGSRLQVLDSNWQVCSQSPNPGKRLRGDSSDFEGLIDFGVVKLTESCP